jgi:hypothetical protein
VKWSEVLKNRVSVIIRRYTDHMKFASSFIFFWFYLVSLYIWAHVLYASIKFCKLCILIMFMYSNCYVCSVLGIVFHCVVLCIVYV